MVEDKLFTAVHPFNRTNLFYEVCCFILSALLGQQQGCSSGAIQVGARVALYDARYPGIYPGVASAS
jgi:hypothetical protein